MSNRQRKKLCFYTILISHIILLSTYRWFDDGEDDGLLERDLILDKGHPWRAIVTTGNDKKASPKVPIVLVIYGEHDKTEEIIIGEDLKNHLKPGATDEFDVILPYYFIIIKIW